MENTMKIQWSIQTKTPQAKVQKCRSNLDNIYKSSQTTKKEGNFTHFFPKRSTQHDLYLHQMIREVIKKENIFLTVRLTVRADPPSLTIRFQDFPWSKGVKNGLYIYLFFNEFPYQLLNVSVRVKCWRVLNLLFNFSSLKKEECGGDGRGEKCKPDSGSILGRLAVPQGRPTIQHPNQKTEKEENKIKNQADSPSGAPNNPTQGDLGKLNLPILTKISKSSKK